MDGFDAGFDIGFDVGFGIDFRIGFGVDFVSAGKDGFGMGFNIAVDTDSRCFCVGEVAGEGGNALLIITVLSGLFGIFLILSGLSTPADLLRRATTSWIPIFLQVKKIQK